MFVILFQYLAFSSFIMFEFYGVLQISYKKKLPLNYFLSGLFIAGGYQFFYLWAFSTKIIEHLPLLLNTEICSGFLIGPFLYSYFCTITGAKKINLVAIVPHLIPFFLSFMLVVFLNISIPSIYYYYVDNTHLLPDYSQNTYIMILNALCNISLAVYFFLTLFRVSSLLRSGHIGFELKVVLSFLLAISINEVILFAADLFQFAPLSIFGLVVFIILPAYYSFFSFRHPGFSIKVIRESKTIRYKSSIKKNLGTDLIESRLRYLMEEEKLYVREDLSLHSLSEKLLIPPHQLSGLLNEKYGRNFNTFINSYRIREAKRLLRYNPEKNILEIAFLVGFNSISSFYTFFLRDTGVAPGTYRKKKIPDL